MFRFLIKVAIARLCTSVDWSNRTFKLVDTGAWRSYSRKPGLFRSETRASCLSSPPRTTCSVAGLSQDQIPGGEQKGEHQVKGDVAVTAPAALPRPRAAPHLEGLRRGGFASHAPHVVAAGLSHILHAGVQAEGTAPLWDIRFLWQHSGHLMSPLGRAPSHTPPAQVSGGTSPAVPGTDAGPRRRRHCHIAGRPWGHPSLAQEGDAD